METAIRPHQLDELLLNGKSKMEQEKRKYFEGQILFGLLSQSILENDPDGKKHNTLWKMVDQAVTLAEARQFLSVPNMGESFLGLSQADLLQKPNPTEVYGSGLLSEVELRLKQTCVDIASYYYSGSSSAQETDKLALARFVQLPQVIRERQGAIEAQKAHLIQLKQAVFQKSWLYYNVIFETFEILWEVMAEFKLKHQHFKDTTLDHYLVAVCENIGLKTRVLKLELLLSVYTGETLSAISKIKEAMEGQVAACEHKLGGLRRQLAGFEELGEEFREISHAYLELNNNINVARDDLRRLRQ